MLDPIVALKAIAAALNQPAVHPADLAYCRRLAEEAIAAAEPPPCAGCGQPTGNPVGMCYECQCDAHAVGWFDMDTGYARP